jgi:exportin-1
MILNSYQNLSESDLVEVIKNNLNILYNSKEPREKWESQKILTDVQNKQDIWKIVPLLINSNESTLAFFGIQILENAVFYNWKSILDQEREFLLNYVWQTILKKYMYLDRDEKLDYNSNKIICLLAKLIISSEKNYFFSFFENIIKCTDLSRLVCEKNLFIASVLLEEFFSGSNYIFRQNIFLEKKKISFLIEELKLLCKFILKQNIFILNTQLNLLSTVFKILTYLKLTRFKNWLVDEKLLASTIFLCFEKNIRNQTLDFLLELNKTSNKDTLVFSALFLENFLLHQQEIFPFSKSYGKMFKDLDQESKDYIMKIVFLLSKTYKNSLKTKFFYILIDFDLFLSASQFMIKISCIAQNEIFKASLEWWNFFFLNKNFYENSLSLKKFIDENLLELIVLMIVRMAKPEEVLIRENDNGHLIRIQLAETESHEMYEKTKNILNNLCMDNYKIIRKVILEKLSMQFKKKNWNRKLLNSLCWSVGAISGSMKEEEEKKFIVLIIKDLLYLCELKKGRDNKAIIASNIMFVVGKYPRFLSSHWKFLKTVISKLFEFMLEDHPGIKDMACDTFRTICTECYQIIIHRKSEEEPALIEYIFNSIDIIEKMDEFRHVEQILAVTGSLISKITDDKFFKNIVQKYKNFIDKKYQLNSIDDKLIENIEKSENFYKGIVVTKNFISFLSKKCDLTFLTGFQNFTSVFKLIDKSIKEEKNFIEPKNLITVNPKITRQIRKEIVNLYIETFKSLNYDSFDFHQKQKIKEIVENLIFSFDFTGDLISQEPVILELISIVLKESRFFIGLDIAKIVFKSFLIPTFCQINNSSVDCSEYKLPFFNSIKSLIENNFKDLFRLDNDPIIAEKSFSLILDSLINGFKEEDAMLSNLALDLVKTFLIKIDLHEQKFYFYNNYLIRLLDNLIISLFDGNHIFAIKAQISVLQLLNEKCKVIHKIDDVYARIEIFFRKFEIDSVIYLELINTLELECESKSIEKNLLNFFKNFLNFDEDEFSED